MNKTILVVVLVAATLLATGLTVIPNAVQNAHANPCSTIGDSTNNPGSNDRGDEVEVKCDLDHVD